MRSVDIQRAKQDKSSLSLQTVECCDINEMITQLNCYNTTTKTFMTTKLLKKLNGNIISIHTFPDIIKNQNNQNRSMSTDPNSTKLSNNNQISNTKITSSYVNNNENTGTAPATAASTPATNNTNHNTISSFFTPNANNNYYTNIKTASNSNYKTFPKFVQNIDSIGFDKPNWKPMLLNEKSSTQQSMTSLNNNGGSNSNQGSRLKSRRGTRNTNNNNNNGTYLQKPQSHSQLDMYLNSDTHKQKINEMTQKHKNENSNLTNDALLQRKKKLFLKSSNLNLKTTTNLQQKCRSTSQSNDSASEESNTETNPITLPLIKSTTFYEKPHESTHRSTGEQTNIQKTPKITDSKISFYDTDLTEALNISKISPSNKYQLYSSTENDLLLEKSQYSNNIDTELSLISHDNQTPYVHQVPLESGGQNLLDANNNLFINNVMKSKQELDAYLSSLKNNDTPVNEMYPPPNSPLIYESQHKQVQPKVMKTRSPASEQQRSVSNLRNSSLLPNRLQKLENNSQKKKLDGSINMVKVNKNILNSTVDSTKLPVVSSVNDKVYVDIFIPSGV